MLDEGIVCAWVCECGGVWGVGGCDCVNLLVVTDDRVQDNLSCSRQVSLMVLRCRGEGRGRKGGGGREGRGG